MKRTCILHIAHQVTIIVDNLISMLIMLNPQKLDHTLKLFQTRLVPVLILSLVICCRALISKFIEACFVLIGLPRSYYIK